MTRVKRIIVSLVFSVGFVLVLIWALDGGPSVRAAPAAAPARAPADEITVCPAGSPTCDYATIQEAVDAANPGDVIKVAQGTYTDVHRVTTLDTSTFTATQIVAITKSITLRGGYDGAFSTWDPDTYRTILDARGMGRGIAIVGMGIAPTVEGLHVTGGDATGLGGVWLGTFWTGDVGAGVYVYQATAIISDNHVYSNTAPIGGGMTLFQSDATLASNAIYSNTSSNGGGGGVYVRHGPATLDQNTLHDNESIQGSGAAIYLTGSDGAQVSRNLVFNNRAATDSGGGIYVDFSAATLADNRVYSNAAHLIGGGIHVYNSSGAVFSGNTITGNLAQQGGGLGVEAGSVMLVNNVVADNRATWHGSGIYVVRAPVQLAHTTIARNTGGEGIGVYVTDKPSQFSHVTMTNTIIVSHSVGVTVTAGNTVTLDSTLWHSNTQGNWYGNVDETHPYNGDPAFAPDGYHILAASMALDRGRDAGVTDDIDGDSRPQGAGYDLGADEFPSAPPDVVWDKRIRIGDGAFQGWDAGPFTIMASDGVTVVERVWITGSGTLSFTLSDAWSPALAWERYDATIGDVSQSGTTATWSAPTAAANQWHVLTKTLRAVAVPGYEGGLTETLVIEGLSLQLPERVSHFQLTRPQPVWEKTVQVNDGVPQPWDAGQFTVGDGDKVTVVDRVWVTHTAGVTFTLGQTWGPGMALQGQRHDVGTVVTGTGTGTLTWHGSGAPAHQWHALTTTLYASGTTWLYDAITETLTVLDAASQPQPRKIDLLNSSGVAGCHVRVNDGATSYHTVQAAVDAARVGDLVKVAGICAAVNDRGGLAQVAYITQSITLRGGYTTTNWALSDPNAHPAILDAQGRGRVLYVSGNVTPIIEGLHITGGDASGLGGMPWGDVGGGIYVNAASAVISHNLIYSNTASDAGGGVVLINSAARLLNNVIERNAMPSGGNGAGVAVYDGSATLSGNVVRHNQGHNWGGGVLISGGAPTLTGNTIISNRVVNGGGGVAVSGNSTARLDGNVIAGNQGGHSAGVRIYFSDPTLRDNLIHDNVAASTGGGLALEGGTTRLVNNVVMANQAGTFGAGIHAVRTEAHLVHNTIARNTGGTYGDGSGVYVTSLTNEYSTVMLTNTLIAGHRVGVTVTAGNEAWLNGTLWHGNTLTDVGGTGGFVRLNDHHGDPAFGPDGYHLTSVSAAIDRGVNAGVTTDVDAQTRPQESGYDVGADEFVCVGLTGVTLTGPTTGTVGTAYAFTATVAPPKASRVISYTWDPAPAPGSLLLPDGSVAAYAWDAAGDYTITLTATNCGGSDTVTRTIHVEPREQYIYLPLILRNG